MRQLGRKADAGDVEKQVAINFAKIDLPAMSGGNNLCSSLIACRTSCFSLANVFPNRRADEFLETAA